MSPGAIKVGYVRRAHGVQGSVVFRPTSDDPERFVPGVTFSTDSPDNPLLTLHHVRAHNDGLLVTFDGVADRNHAERLRGVSLFIQSGQRRELDTGEYWPEQLIGLRVVDRTGNGLGVVTEIIEGTTQDRLVVAGERTTFEVPFVAALVPEVDVAAHQIVVDLPEGLIDSP